jgi:hypothetical protein
MRHVFENTWRCIWKMRRKIINHRLGVHYSTTKLHHSTK